MSRGDSETGRTVKREVYGTENSWCRAVPGGTGVTVLGLLLKTPTFDTSLLQTAIHTLQNHHPILRSKLHHHHPGPHFIIPPPSSPPSLVVHSFDPHATSQITTTPESTGGSTLHAIVEHQMNHNPWSYSDSDSDNDSECDVMHVSVFEVGDGTWTVVIKLHTAACDRTAALEILRELMPLLLDNNNDNDRDKGEGGGLRLGIEEYVPPAASSKPFWARGIDMLGYSLNSFRFSNLSFVDPASQRSSRVARLLLDAHHTRLLLQGCKSRGIKLCGALSAAGLIAARLSKGLSNGEWEKYAVVTLIDCRKLLQPPLTNHHVGFYHSAILNTHDLQGDEDLWGLARRTYKSFEDAKNSNKHFTDMADLNFLMCKAIENPGLTPSSSLRTSFISVFEDPVHDETNDKYEELGIEDYMGCASVHGVGPSIAVFDTIRDGKLDCACVYPFPLHSREQMQELIDSMKKILIDCLSSENEC